MWNEADADRRAALIEANWAADATFVDPSFEVTGHDDLNKLVGAAQQMFPGLAFVRIGDIDEHHTYLRWTWHLTAEGQEPVAGGTDIVLLDRRRQDPADDRLPRLRPRPLTQYRGMWSQCLR